MVPGSLDLISQKKSQEARNLPEDLIAVAKERVGVARTLQQGTLIKREICASRFMKDWLVDQELTLHIYGHKKWHCTTGRKEARLCG